MGADQMGSGDFAPVPEEFELEYGLAGSGGLSCPDPLCEGVMINGFVRLFCAVELNVWKSGTEIV